VADGQNANVGFSSYLAVGRESTFKTYVTATAGLDFLSASFKTTVEQKTIESISTKRTYSDRISLSKTVEGEVEFHMAADSDAAVFLLHNAFGGGAVSSASATGDATTGAGVMDHTFSINNFDASNTSLSFNHRKGDATNGKIFEYKGCRVNEFTLTGEVDEPLMANASIIAVDSSVSSNDISANILTVTGQTPLSFVNMRLSVEGTFASLTTSSFWHVQSFEFGINNQLKSDSDSRRIGTNTLDVLPPGVAQFTLNFSMRFDTLTAYNAMLSETQLAAQLMFVGPTLSGSTLPQRITINMPRIFIQDAGDPEVGGPDEILKAEISCLVLRDDSSAAGYAVQAVVRNKTASY
jgi:hypothetical protein